MNAGERFRLFRARARWKRKASRLRARILDFPEFPAELQPLIRQAWSRCLCFRGEENWDAMVAGEADKIIQRHKWLEGYEYYLRQAISNY
jgi:hypothetical protein